MISPHEFMTSAPAASRAPAPGGNTAWAGRYGAVLRQVVHAHAEQAPRSLQAHLGPSEIGHSCDRQVAGKLAGLPATNHVLDPWPSVIGTAVHAWLAEAFAADNERLGQIRWVPEQRVVPIDGHSGTADLYDAQELAVVDHKGLHVDTPIPTPTGWTTAGRLRTGDEVFGADGHPCRVTRTYPVQQRDCYRVRFTDGSSLITDDVQELPLIRSVGRNLHPCSVPVSQAAELVWSSAARPQRQLRLYNGAALELPDLDLVVHPYVLGCWLGDGGVHGGAIGKPDDELFTRIEACGYQVGPRIGQAKSSRTIYGLTTQLQTLGLQWVDEAHRGASHRQLAGHKRIPVEYLRASRSQRLALLQGLMDTDGTWNRARRQAVFTTTDKGLAAGCAELVASLGWKAKVFAQQAHGYGLTVTAYHVAYTPFEANPFRLNRKADLVRVAGSTQSRYRLIAGIEPTLSVPTRCIDVDSPDRLYLAGEQMIPVHNCLGPSSIGKVRSPDGPPVHYVVQLLLYARGYRRLGLPVRRVALVAYPRTAPSLDGLYVWEREHTLADDVLLDEVIARLEYRKQWAVALVTGAAQLLDVPADTSDSCHFCPFYRPQTARDGGPGCPGHASGPQ